MDRKVIISFDVWGTLIKASPDFSKAKVSLIRKYAGREVSENFINNVFKEVKSEHNLIIEKYGNQPDNLTMFCQIFSRLSIDCDLETVSLFKAEYSKLFIEHPPLLIKNTRKYLQKLVESGCILVISSNTLLIPGYRIEQVLNNLGVLKRFRGSNFSDQRKKSKPNKQMFLFTGLPTDSTIPDFHVGDNPVTDGSCERYGIQFYQINSNNKTIEDFYNEKFILCSSDH